MPYGLSPLHLIILLVVVLLVLGPSRLPQTGEAMGKAIRSFREAVEGKPDAPAGTGGAAPAPVAPPAAAAPSPSIPPPPPADQPPV